MQVVRDNHLHRIHNNLSQFYDLYSDIHSLSHYVLHHCAYHLSVLGKTDELWKLIRDEEYRSRQFLVSGSYTSTYDSFKYSIAHFVGRQGGQPEDDARLVRTLLDCSQFMNKSETEIIQLFDVFRKDVSTLDEILDKISILQSRSVHRAHLLLLWLEIERQRTLHILKRDIEIPHLILEHISNNKVNGLGNTTSEPLFCLYKYLIIESCQTWPQLELMPLYMKLNDLRLLEGTLGLLLNDIYLDIKPQRELIEEILIIVTSFNVPIDSKVFKIGILIDLSHQVLSREKCTFYFKKILSSNIDIKNVHSILNRFIEYSYFDVYTSILQHYPVEKRIPLQSLPFLLLQGEFEYLRQLLELELENISTLPKRMKQTRLKNIQLYIKILNNESSNEDFEEMFTERNSARIKLPSIVIPLYLHNLDEVWMILDNKIPNGKILNYFLSYCIKHNHVDDILKILVNFGQISDAFQRIQRGTAHLLKNGITEQILDICIAYLKPDTRKYNEHEQFIIVNRLTKVFKIELFQHNIKEALRIKKAIKEIDFLLFNQYKYMLEPLYEVLKEFVAEKQLKFNTQFLFEFYSDNEHLQLLELATYLQMKGLKEFASICKMHLYDRIDLDVKSGNTDDDRNHHLLYSASMFYKMGYFQRSMQILEDITDENFLELPIVYMYMVEIYLRDNDTTMADIYFQKCLQELNSVENVDIQSSILRFVSVDKRRLNS